MAVSNQEEVRDFLTTRRAKVRPERVELPAGDDRRVPGLRRTEVAMLAGISVEYDARLERGNQSGVSDSVLDAIARALQFDDAEQFYPDWDEAANTIVAILRAEAGRNPHDKDLQDLIGELSTLSRDFRATWGTHDVRRHANGEKHFNHPFVGRLDLLFESADLTAEPGWKLLIYTAEPASRPVPSPHDQRRRAQGPAPTPRPSPQSPSTSRGNRSRKKRGPSSWADLTPPSATRSPTTRNQSAARPASMHRRESGWRTRSRSIACR